MCFLLYFELMYVLLFRLRYLYEERRRKTTALLYHLPACIVADRSLLLATYLVACDQRCSTVGNTKEVSGILLVLHRLFDFGWAGAPLRSDD
jgi:hypothetical protein